MSSANRTRFRFLAATTATVLVNIYDHARIETSQRFTHGDGPGGCADDADGARVGCGSTTTVSADPTTPSAGSRSTAALYYNCSSSSRESGIESTKRTHRAGRRVDGAVSADDASPSATATARPRRFRFSTTTTELLNI